jgi:hypothetical protein
MARRLPFPEVTEIELEGNAASRGAQLRGMGFDAGNPNVPPGGSAEANAWRARTAAPAPAAAPPTPQPRPYQLGYAAGNTVRAALLPTTAGAAGAALAGTVNSLRQQELNNAPAFVPPPTAPGQIPGADPRYQAPPAAAGRFMDQTELRRNVGNALMAMPGGAGVLRGLSTVAQAASRTAPATRLATAAPVAAAGARGFVAGDVAMPGTAPAPAQPGATPVEAAYSNEGRNYPTATAASELRAPNLGGKIVRNGNSYSGSNIKFGADIVDPKGNLVNGGDPNNPKGFGVSSLDTSAGYQADLRELGRLRAERAEREAGYAANQPGGGVGGFNTASVSGVRSVTPETIARDEMQRAMRDMSPRARAQAAMQQAQLAQRMAEAQMGNATTLRGQDIGASTTMRGQDIGASTARRGQDITARGQDMDYAEKIDARMMDLMARRQLRDGMAEIFKASGGNMEQAARMATALGYPADAFLKLAEYGSTRAADGDKVIDRVAESLSVDPATGKIDPAAVAKNRVAIKKNNDVVGATPEQLAANEAKITARQRLLNNTNAVRDVGLGYTLGISTPSPEYGAMPDLRGAVLDEVGFWEGMFTGNNVEKGDIKLKRPGAGDPVYIKRDGLDDAAYKLLEDDYGVKLRR